MRLPPAVFVFTVTALVLVRVSPHLDSVAELVNPFQPATQQRIVEPAPSERADDVMGRQADVDLGWVDACMRLTSGAATAAGSGSGPAEWARPVFAGLITAFVLAASLFSVMSSRYREAERRWAYGSIGAILGFWLA
jgi:hypothetical protein